MSDSGGLMSRKDSTKQCAEAQIWNESSGCQRNRALQIDGGHARDDANVVVS